MKAFRIMFGTFNTQAILFSLFSRPTFPFVTYQHGYIVVCYIFLFLQLKKIKTLFTYCYSLKPKLNELQWTIIAQIPVCLEWVNLLAQCGLRQVYYTVFFFITSPQHSLKSKYSILRIQVKYICTGLYIPVISDRNPIQTGLHNLSLKTKTYVCESSPVL